MGLCVGGELKSTIAVVRGGRAILSQHLGDITQTPNMELFRKTIADLCDLFDVRPRWIAHDCHPGYLSTLEAQRLARRWDVPLVAVQHHHAHAAAVLAENGMAGPVLALVCDGTGYGEDGTIWGGELLEVSLTASRRLGRVRPLRLPGGDASARDVRRCALALLYQALGNGFEVHPIVQRLVPRAAERGVLCRMIERNVQCAESSGTGRYFDAMSALLGICEVNHFEAQGAMALEGAATYAQPTQHLLPVLRQHESMWEIDLAPFARNVVERIESESADVLAREFHEHLGHALALLALQGVDQTGHGIVALSGGVFCNELLMRCVSEHLERHGVKVLRHRVVPPNDGGISLGQAAVAAAIMEGAV